MRMQVDDAWGAAIEVTAPGIRAVLAAKPVTTESYLAFLEATGRETPRAVTRGRRLSEPAVHVTYADAQAFCAWFGRETGRDVRLPSVSELVELTSEITEQGIDREIWAHDRQAHHGAPLQPAAQGLA